MTKRILVDAVHPEEIRVAVADEAKLLEFDFESHEKKQIKSNIYLGKITRVEPSLQAAFVEYGGNRQGFLPFSEIHFDYFQIPVEDKEKLVKTLEAERKKQEQRMQELDSAETLQAEAAAKAESKAEKIEVVEKVEIIEAPAEPEKVEVVEPKIEAKPFVPQPFVLPDCFTEKDIPDLKRAEELAKQFAFELLSREEFAEKYGSMEKPSGERFGRGGDRFKGRDRGDRGDRGRGGRFKDRDNNRDRDRTPREVEKPKVQLIEEQPIVSNIIDEEEDDISPVDERAMSRMEFYKQYKIQEVIKRNQVVLIQIVKEERGTKGASLTTYLALAGRYSVFMPNTDKGGGVSRRISNFSERRRIRDVIRQLNTHAGTSVIIRTAGMEREFDDIKKDYDYLLSVWDNIRKQTLESSAPALIYEESDIVKRSLRDMLKADVSEVYIEGKETFNSAKRFMEVIGSSQVDMLKEYTGKIPIFQKFKIEERLDELYEPEIKLSSGGSIVITPTEALVSIDVNSGKSTQERSVEDTALKTNIEAAREIARQLKLRDLAGLVVIDFIDMREVRNRKAVERELKDALKADRAKIQIGRISAFGLLEMSRQRLRSSIVESSSGRCPMCKGIGVVRTTESLTLKAIRAIESEAGKKSVKEIFLKVSHTIAHNIESHRKREIEAIEKSHGVKIVIEIDNLLLPNQFEISPQKFSSGGKQKQPHQEREKGHKARPQQEVAAVAAIPSEAQIDADVGEQLSAWQSEVADVERIKTPRRYDNTAPEPGNSEGNSDKPRGDRPDRGERRPGGGRHNNNRNRGRNNNGGRNNNNRGGGRRPEGGARPHRYNNNSGGNIDGDSFGNEQSNDFRENYQGEARKDIFKEGPRERLYAEPVSEVPKVAAEDKAASSKLVGLWKKITS